MNSKKSATTISGVALAIGLLGAVSADPLKLDFANDTVGAEPKKKPLVTDQNLHL